MTEDELQRLADQQLAALKVTLAMLDQARARRPAKWVDAQKRQLSEMSNDLAPRLRVIRGGAA